MAKYNKKDTYSSSSSNSKNKNSKNQSNPDFFSFWKDHPTMFYIKQTILLIFELGAFVISIVFLFIEGR